MLESALHADNAFVTLTISDEHLEYAQSGLPTLNPVVLRNFIKRLRKSFASTHPTKPKFRYYAVGEYGDKTQRPHYHLALFGFPTCERGRTFRLSRNAPPDWKRCCNTCSMVGIAWGFGNVDLGTLESDSAQYVAQYTVKKMTSGRDGRLDGRHPEFARMSLKPGLAADCTWEIASTLLNYPDHHNSQGDVPVSLRHGRKLLPLGRYLRRLIRQRMGKGDVASPEVTQALWEKEMLPLLQAAKTSKTHPSLRSQVALKNEPHNLQLEAREKIHKQRKSL